MGRIHMPGQIDFDTGRRIAEPLDIRRIGDHTDIPGQLHRPMLARRHIHPFTIGLHHIAVRVDGPELFRKARIVQRMKKRYGFFRRECRYVHFNTQDMIRIAYLDMLTIRIRPEMAIQRFHELTHFVADPGARNIIVMMEHMFLPMIEQSL